MEKAVETSIEATSFAHKNGLAVVFLPVDFSRAELKWAVDLIDLIDKVGTEGHPPSPFGLRRDKHGHAFALRASAFATLRRTGRRGKPSASRGG